MAVSWMPRTTGGFETPPELLELDTDNALRVFPPEVQTVVPRVSAPPRHRSGVTMRVAPISFGVALGMVATLLAGAGGAAAIGLLVGRVR